MKPTERQQKNFPRIRKPIESSFKITEVKATSQPSEIKPEKEAIRSEPRKEEFASKELTIEEKFIEHVEKDRTIEKRSSKGKIAGIIIGVIAVIIIGGGAAFMGSNSDLFSSNNVVEDRLTCEDEIMLVKETKVPGFPDPEKDLQHYIDRYENEPKYKEWFDRNFPGQTVRQAVC